MNKNDIRLEYKKIRSKMSRNEVVEKSIKVLDMLTNSDLYKSVNSIMLYYPLGNEVDVSLLFNKAFSDSKTVLLPITVNDIITPTRIYPDTKYIKGEYSILEPEDKTPFRDKIDACIVPGIAFDKSGARVGFGKGCYDRFLTNKDIIKIGYCYDFQLCDGIFTDDHDIKMDYIVTESEFITCE